METCSECGALTPLGMAKERRLRRRATRIGVWQALRHDEAFSAALVLAGLLALLVAVAVFAMLVSRGAI